LLAKDLDLIDPCDRQDLAEQTMEVKRRLSALLQKLRANG
jgi:hypothetical protein